MSSSRTYKLEKAESEEHRRMHMERPDRSLPTMLNTSQRTSSYQISPGQGYPYPHTSTTQRYPHTTPTYTSSPDMYPHGIAAQADAFHDPYAAPAPHQYPQYNPSYPYSPPPNYLPPMQEPPRFRREAETSAGYGESSYPHMHGAGGYPEASSSSPGYEYGRSAQPRSMGERSSKIPKRRISKPRYSLKPKFGFDPRNAFLIGSFADWSQDGYHDREPEEQASMPNQPKAEKKHLCDHQDCDRSQAGNGFTTPNDLDRHKRSVHKEKGIYFQCRDLNCGDNGKYFARRDNFVDHCRRMHKFPGLSEDEIKTRLVQLAREWVSIKGDDGQYTHQGTSILPPRPAY